MPVRRAAREGERIADRCYDGDGKQVLPFCDSSGFGSPSEPALQYDEIVALARSAARYGAARSKTIGVGIYEEGQFQIHLRIFEKRESRARRAA